MTPRGHEIFSRFRLTPGSHDGVISRNCVGATTRAAYEANVMAAQADRAHAVTGEVRGLEPPVNDEYFEWIDVLSAVAAYAGGPRERPFVFAELGAGFGRWSANAICALRRLDPQADYLILAVEAEPAHFAWLKVNLAENGIPPERCRLHAAPVSGRAGEVLFHGGDAHHWYGQSIAEPAFVDHLKRHPRAQSHANAYLPEATAWWLRWYDWFFGPRVRREMVRMQAITLDEVLRDAAVVDIVDMDIQGAEADVIEHGLEVLDEKVLVLHVGTHSAEIEQRLRAVLGARGWSIKADYGCHGRHETPYGPIQFQDGVQSWHNEELVRTCASRPGTSTRSR